jgi:hypothetical protein
MPGVPDVLITDTFGRFQLIELKNCKGKAVKLSPHQVSFLSAHANSLVWLLVRATPSSAPDQYYLYRGDQASEVSKNGIRVEPHLTDFNLEPILRLIDSTKLGI